MLEYQSTSGCEVPDNVTELGETSHLVSTILACVSTSIYAGCFLILICKGYAWFVSFLSFLNLIGAITTILIVFGIEYVPDGQQYYTIVYYCQDG